MDSLLLTSRVLSYQMNIYRMLLSIYPQIIMVLTIKDYQIVDGLDDNYSNIYLSHLILIRSLLCQLIYCHNVYSCVLYHVHANTTSHSIIAYTNSLLSLILVDEFSVNG
jgi:hypothetical protein